MYKFIYLILYITLNVPLYGQVIKRTANFTFKGQLKGKKNGVLYLSYINETGKFTEQKVFIKDGVFLFKGRLKEPTHAFIKTAGNIDYNNGDPNFAELFIEPGSMQGQFTWNHFKEAIITGSRSQKEFDLVVKVQRTLLRKRDSLAAQLNRTRALMENDILSKSLHEKDSTLQHQIHSNNQQLYHFIFSFIASHPDSYVSPYLLFYNQPFIQSDSLRRFYDGWNRGIQNSYWGRKVSMVIAGLPGSIALDLTATGWNGDTIALTVINKNKIVLIDFWATWCVPCRAGNSHLIQLYEMYHQKGFDIISIADDDTNIASWKRAIQHDGAGSWHQVLKGAGTENDIGIKYNAVSYPTKILIDQSGKIIFRGEGSNDAALDKKLVELFGE